MKNKFNAILLNLENHLQVFKLDENNKLINPSIPINNSLDKVYDYVTGKHMVFINTNLKEGEDMNDDKFYTKMIESYIFDESIVNIMKEDKLQECVDTLIKEINNEKQI